MYNKASDSVLSNAISMLFDDPGTQPRDFEANHSRTAFFQLHKIILKFIRETLNFIPMNVLDEVQSCDKLQS